MIKSLKVCDVCLEQTKEPSRIFLKPCNGKGNVVLVEIKYSSGDRIDLCKKHMIEILQKIIEQVAKNEN